ncbi:MAG: hypothetical protein HY606_10865 [Planctomycetes bacterium]|nr:hypothetical protein [Planctomycetota bacterium]
MSSWFSIFLFTFTLGTLIYPLILINKKDITENFIRTPIYVGLFLSLIYLMIADKSPQNITFFLSALLISFFWNQSIIKIIGYLVLFGASGVILYKLNPNFKDVIKLGLSSLVNGCALGTMLLGHSYLSNKLMSFTVLINNTKLLLLFFILNILFSLFLISTQLPVFKEFYDSSDLVLAFIVLRFATEVISPFLTLMALKCAKLHSNQSATGILYSVCTVVLISEITNIYLHFSRGILV